MIQHEIFHPSWPLLFHDVTYDSIIYNNNYHDLDFFSDPFSCSVSGSSFRIDDFPNIIDSSDDLCLGFDEAFFEGETSSQNSAKSEISTVDVSSKQQALILPYEETEIDNELSISHLLRAYSEAVEKGQRELERVILRRVNEKSNPLGKALERLAFNLSREFLNESDNFLKRESTKSFDAAFEAFYRIFPYGKFAHFTANSAILTAAETITAVQVVDFDLGEGLQWSQMIEELAAKKFTRLRVTSVRWPPEEEEESDPPRRSFNETRKNLTERARSCGLDLKMEEIDVEDLVNDLKKKKKKSNGLNGEEFWAFNCAVGIPHTRRARNRSQVTEFVSLAKDFLLANNENNNNSLRGILVLADGEPCERDCSSFSQFFEGHIGHYKAKLESMEAGFPSRLLEARTGMECLFVAPFVRSDTWQEEWKRVKNGSGLGDPEMTGLAGLRLSGESLSEGNEMVRGESCYGVRIGGCNGNEASLEWNGVPLVKVSVWTSQT